MYYKLVHLDGQSDICLDEWNLTLPATIGRCETSSISLNSPTISREHCRFRLNAYGALTIQDLGSKNGIYVRDRRVKEATVMVGEVFQIGGLSVKVEEIAQPIPETDDTRSAADSMYDTQPVDIYEIP
ncbi:MAG: FHA domain-containing protein [Aureliella sp.]